MKKLFLGLAIAVLSAQAYAQSGPGGVGSSANLEAWFKADTGLVNNNDLVAAAGDSIKTWRDQSGNNNDASQTMAANQPPYSANGPNNFPGIAFDGVSNLFLDLTLNLANDATIFIVGQNAIQTDVDNGFRPMLAENRSYSQSGKNARGYGIAFLDNGGGNPEGQPGVRAIWPNNNKSNANVEIAPIFADNSSADLSVASRIISAFMRNRGPRERKTFSGS